MELSAVLDHPLQGPEICDILDDAYDRFIAFWISTEVTGACRIQIAAGWTLVHRIGGFHHRIGQGPQQCFLLLQELKDGPFCGPGSKTGQFG